MGIRVHYAPARLISKEHLLAASAKGCGARFPLVATWCAAICWAPYTRTAARGDAYRKQVYERLGIDETADQITFGRYLAAQPFVDASPSITSAGG